MQQWKTTPLHAGAFALDGGGMFGLIPRTMWSQWVETDDRNRVQLQCNAALLDDGSRFVLIETGFGDKWTAKERDIYALEERTVVDALREVGVTPEEISAVVVTHLHFDHAAGLTRWNERGEAVPTFPNADIVVQRQEWLDAGANRSTMTRTYLDTHLVPIADRVRTVDGAREVLPGIHVTPLPGHTWGQQGVLWDDEEGPWSFIGDLLPTVHHVHPAANTAYDVLPYENMQQKRSFLNRCVDEGRRILLDHEPGPPVVRVERDAERPERLSLRSI